MLACVANVFLACFSFLIHKVTDTVIKAKHENDGGGEEEGKDWEVFFPSPPPHPPPPPPPSPRPPLRTTNEEHTKKPLCSVPRKCFFFSWDCILCVVELRNYVIYFKNLTSQEPNRNFCTTPEHVHSELNATIQT